MTVIFILRAPFLLFVRVIPPIIKKCDGLLGIYFKMKMYNIIQIIQIQYCHVPRKGKRDIQQLFLCSILQS